MRKKTAKKSMNFIIPLVIYPFDVMVSIGQTNEELELILKKHGISTHEDIQEAMFTSDTTQGRTVMFSSNQTIIRLKYKPQNPKDFNTLAHEIFHAASFVLWKIGMELRIRESDEAYAYLIGYLTEKIHEKL